MIVSCFSVDFDGVEPCKIEVQVSTTMGVPKMIISGLATRVVREARERILAGLKSQQMKLKSCRTVVNLMPTNISKKGNHLELAMAVGIMGSHLGLNIKKDDCFIGAVGLDGRVQAVPALLALSLIHISEPTRPY